MTRFEYFESGQGLEAVRLGVVCVDLLTKYHFYKTYREFLQSGNSESESKKLASDECDCHYSNIVRAINWFEGKFETEKFKRISRRRDGQLKKNSRTLENGLK